MAIKRRGTTQGVTHPTIQQKVTSSIEQNFTGGLKTEFTGLNFPENACTSVDNCVFSIIGDVLRREGINFEANYFLNDIFVANSAINTYRWLNAGGDGDTEVLVLQVGATLYFFESSNSTAAAPLSTTVLMSTVILSGYLATGNLTFDATTECQFTTGNGYLFVFHPSIDPVYCVFNNGVILPNSIQVQIRDFTGFYPEPGNPAIGFRPTTLTMEHNYNLLNQGWTGAPLWTAVATNILAAGSLPLGQQTFVVASGLTGVTVSQLVSIAYSAYFLYYDIASGNYYYTTGTGTATGVVSSYSGTSLGIDVTTSTSFSAGPGTEISVVISTTSTINPGLVENTINTWYAAVNNYPSNADIWYLYKDDTDVFNPTDTYGNVTEPTAIAPQGHFILNAFNQQQSTVSGLNGVTNISTTTRPKTGCWFQGRVWYAGVDASQQATGDQNFYTWTENIYFSQVISNVTEFGYCYQENDPTDETFFDLLPTDGGVINIQGSGTIYKLYPLQNGILVFADNGVWSITGNSALGFTANDYNISKISSIQNISSTSYVDVMGLPIFWNEEGIYAVEMGQNNVPYGHGGYNVNPLTVGTILSFYNDIPLDSKRYARGAYDPTTYIINWVYRSTEEAGISNRYQFDSSLNLNVYNKAFYPYTFANNNACYVSGITYMNYPEGSLIPQFKYLTQAGSSNMTFSEENDDVSWFDWFSYDGVGVNYTSNFVTGYKLHGGAMRRFQPMYIYMFSRNDVNNGYNINSIWDFATSGNSGKYSSQQVINNAVTNFGMVYRRHRLRGHGLSLQIQVSSIAGMPFDIMGWSMMETVSGSV